MTFTVGQSVKFNGMSMPATIMSGPHPTHGADRWLIRKADGKVSLVKVAELSPVMSRREAAAYVLFESQTGRKWATAATFSRTTWLRLADRVLAAADEAAAPVKRDLTAGDKVRILKSGLESALVNRGDVLTVTTVRGEYVHTNAPSLSLGGTWSFKLSGEGEGWERV